MEKGFQECHLYKSCLDDAIPKKIDNNMDLSPCKPLTKKNDHWRMSHQNTKGLLMRFMWLLKH